jgi:hypothetical protein
MSSERKTFLIWWTALLLFIAIAGYIKYSKGRDAQEPNDDVPEQKDNGTLVNPASAPPDRSWSRELPKPPSAARAIFGRFDPAPAPSTAGTCGFDPQVHLIRADFANAMDPRVEARPGQPNGSDRPGTAVVSLIWPSTIGSATDKRSIG